MSSEISTDARSPSSFRPWQFFVLAGLIAATAVVFVLRDQPPSHVFFVSLGIIAASLVGVAAHRAVWPLVAAGEPGAPEMIGSRTRVSLEREKLLLLRSLKELEFDRAMGKLSQADFEELSERLRARAARLIRQIDQGASGYRELVERELASRLGRLATVATADPVAPARGTAAPAAGEMVRQSAREVRALQCPACETLNDLDARFCKRCGQPFEQAP